MFLSVPLHILHAVAVLAPTKNTRTRINGVNVQTRPSGHVILSATDGVGLLQARLPAPDCLPDFNRTIPAEFIKSLPKKKQDVVLYFGPDDFNVTAGDKSWTGKLLPKTDVFPNVSRIYPPPGDTGEPAEFDFMQLARFSKAAEIAGWAPPRIQAHGDKYPGVITFGGETEAVGVLQRWRYVDKEGKQIPFPPEPEWVR